MGSAAAAPVVTAPVGPAPAATPNFVNRNRFGDAPDDDDDDDDA